MIKFDTSHTEVASVSNPGVVRNFRVQVRKQGIGQWQMYRTFRNRQEAESCVADLNSRNLEARLVDCDRCPTAI